MHITPKSYVICTTWYCEQNHGVAHYFFSKIVKMGDKAVSLVTAMSRKYDIIKIFQEGKHPNPPPRRLAPSVLSARLRCASVGAIRSFLLKEAILLHLLPPIKVHLKYLVTHCKQPLSFPVWRLAHLKNNFKKLDTRHARYSSSRLFLDLPRAY